MDTSTLPTAPLWSADPHPYIDRLGSSHDEHTRELLHQAARDLDRYAARTGQPHTAIDRFLAGPDGLDGRRDAYAAIATFALLGVLQAPAPAWPGWHSDGPGKRILRGVELGLVRLAAGRSDTATVQVAAMEAGAASPELPDIVAADLTADGDGWVLSLPGTRRLAARQVRLPAWAAPAVGRLRSARGDRPLLYGGRSRNAADRESAVLMSIRNTYRAARLHQDRTITPESLRNTGARAAYEQAGGDGLAAAIGVLGLDHPTRVLERIGLAPSAADTVIDWDEIYLAGL